MLESLFKKILQHRCFPGNITKFLKTDYFIEHLRWLLLVKEYLGLFQGRGTNLDLREYELSLELFLAIPLKVFV